MKKLIDSKFIRTLDPCEDGILDFESKHPKFKGTLSDILSLPDISYSNKLWLACKLAPTKIMQQWSVECAEYVLPNYEREFPNDTRIRDCLDTIKLVLAGKLPARASARASAWSAALAAESARASAWSAAWSAESAWASAESARASARASAWSAESAWASAESAGVEELEQETINLSLLIALLKNEGL